jgi:hypothetical protein
LIALGRSRVTHRIDEEVVSFRVSSAAAMPSYSRATLALWFSF